MSASKKTHQLLTAMMTRLADFVGRPVVFVSVVLLLVVWFVCKQYVEYDIWLDIMDIAIFVITFLLLFVIQASQNADTEAIQDKLDEIIDALPNASKSKEGEEKDFKEGKKNNK